MKLGSPCGMWLSQSQPIYGILKGKSVYTIKIKNNHKIGFIK